MSSKELIFKSILAGICIGIGGTLFLSIDNKIVGSLFFTLGLFTICTRGYHLFTGRIGYALDNDKTYAFSLIITWVGNLIGTNIVAYSLQATRISQLLMDKATIICNTKLADNLLSIFILSVFCNILMFIAVDGFKTNKHELGKYIGLFICVAGFILAGFEHCIANMFYFGMANAWSLHTILYLFVMTLGNIVGGLLLPVLEKICKA